MIINHCLLTMPLKCGAGMACFASWMYTHELLGVLVVKVYMDESSSFRGTPLRGLRVHLALPTIHTTLYISSKISGTLPLSYVYFVSQIFINFFVWFLFYFILLALSIGQRLCINISISIVNFLTTLRSLGHFILFLVHFYLMWMLTKAKNI